MANTKISIIIVSVSGLLVFVCILASVHYGITERAKRGGVSEENRIKRSMTAVERYGCSSCLPTATDVLSQQGCCEDDSSVSHYGRDGRDGRDGRVGEKGQKGEVGNCLKGDQGEPGQDATQLGTTGASYIRWGRPTCPSTSELVYEGIVGGSHFAKTGGAANYLCMPLDPEYLDIGTGTEGSRNYVHTTEYESDVFPPFSHLHDHNVPCALCRVSKRGIMIMIPAKTTCPSDWTTEYKGYLMSGYKDHVHQSEYLCVDQNAEAIPDTSHNYDGALLYLVESACGGSGLPCTPYIAGYELACVVCTI